MFDPGSALKCFWGPNDSFLTYQLPPKGGGFGKNGEHQITIFFIIRNFQKILTPFKSFESEFFDSV